MKLCYYLYCYLRLFLNDRGLLKQLKNVIVKKSFVTRCRSLAVVKSCQNIVSSFHFPLPFLVLGGVSQPTSYSHCYHKLASLFFTSRRNRLHFPMTDRDVVYLTPSLRMGISLCIVLCWKTIILLERLLSLLLI